VTTTERAAIDTLIVGAGPYGLSLSSHLKRAGVTHKLLGRTMESWAEMPKGMCLRSPVGASSLSDPDGALTLEAFSAQQRRPLSAPLPLETFLEYCEWFVERAGLDIDPRLVTNLTADDGGFSAVLEDGDLIRARHVVVATGHKAFQWTPPEFRDLPADLVSHPGDHDDFAHFAGKEVVVVGAGQSGIECAALAHECGAAVRVLMRRQGVNWLVRSAFLHSSWLSPLLYSWSDVGPAGLSQVVSAPDMFRRMPARWRQRATRRCARPAAAAWLVARTQDVPIETRCSIRAIAPAAGRIRIQCEDGQILDADHVLLATGYRVDLGRYTFIAPELRAAVKTVDGSPVLGPASETSVPGLYMLGWPAVWSYGPLMRHVAGAHFGARAVTEHLAAARPRGDGQVASRRSDEHAPGAIRRSHDESFAASLANGQGRAEPETADSSVGIQLHANTASLETEARHGGERPL
jgi:FAD-dependent urate hydroxylase